MKKIIATLLMATACLCAMGQNNQDSPWEDDNSFSFGNSKWEGGVSAAFMYNFSLGAPKGMSPSGFGMELAPMEMRWKGWNRGYVTVGILDMYFDWQLLQKGNRFSVTTPGEIASFPSGRGNRFNFGLGFPIGISHQFGSDFGLSVAVTPGVGWYRYVNEYDDDNFHHQESFYPKEKRVHFQLDVKAIIWYSEFGVVVRYNPLPAKDVNTTILSVGLAFRS